MMKHCRDFEDEYKACNGAFVLMGDDSFVTVAGYDTCYMKINSNVTHVHNSLHVPDLDSIFFQLQNIAAWTMDILSSLKVKICSYCSQNFRLHSLIPKIMTQKGLLTTNVG